MAPRGRPRFAQRQRFSSTPSLQYSSTPRPDPPRTGIITNGQTFLLKYESDLDRNFYVASVNWSAPELLAAYSNAVIRLTLLANKTVHTTAPKEALP